MPDDVQSLVQELIDDKLLVAAPNLDDGQWRSISEIADKFAVQGPNRQARHVRKKLAVYKMLGDARSGVVVLD